VVRELLLLLRSSDHCVVTSKSGLNLIRKFVSAGLWISVITDY
jgi:hypothetical protein